MSRESGKNGRAAEAVLPFRIHESVSIDGNRLTLPLSWSEEVELLYFKSGRFRVMVELSEYEISEECICFVNPGELRRVSALSEGAVEYSVRFRLDCLLFQQEDITETALLRPLAAGKLSFPRFIGVSDLGNAEILCWTTALLQRFRRLGERCPSIRSSEKLVLRSASDSLLLKAELLRLIGLLDSYGLLREARQRTADRQVQVIKQTVLHIRENYQRRIYVRDLAALVGLNGHYFIHFFKRVMGVPPLEYINRFRVQQAKRELTESRDRAYEVAARCGFHNIGNFIRVFRAVTGMTPNRFRDYRAESMHPRDARGQTGE